MKIIRIALFLLMLAGIGLLLTQKMWVPSLVSYILRNDANFILLNAHTGKELSGNEIENNTNNNYSKLETVPVMDAKSSPSTSQVPKNYLTDEQVNALADNSLAKGNVPLGDYRYTTSAPKKGYVYLCNARKENPGSMVSGTWVHGNSWNIYEKVSVDGNVDWPNAIFNNLISGAQRLLTGNSLPTHHTTGVFPVALSDDASKFDRNPNTISAQNLKANLPLNPVYSETPYCMGGEVGIMLTGVPIFNAFDAGLRDAPAHELQDSCDGHPQGSGEYHYHSLSSCFKDVSVKTVLGFAYDGFPITGPSVSKDAYLTTDDLDMCHGITSEIVLDGKPKITYHYVMTRDFPYSASCFRGKPITTGPSVKQSQNMNQPQGSGMNNSSQGNGPTQGAPAGSPPDEAVTACLGKSIQSQCSIVTPQGDTIMGVCQIPPNASLACIPNF